MNRKSTVYPIVLAGGLLVFVYSILSAQFGAPSPAVYATEDVIYGDDDRIDVYQETDPERLQQAQSVAAIIPLNNLTDNGDGTYEISAPTLSQSFLTNSGAPACDDEPFADQPTPAFCTGFLVGNNIVATAGHCFGTTADLANAAFVFGVQMINATTPVTTVNANQIYTGTGFVSRALEADGTDYALIRTDRPVNAPGAQPLPVRAAGKISNTAPVGVMGHPSGLPLKIAFGDDTRVYRNGNDIYFESNLDTYGGNSGSPVFNQNTGVVEGILVRGRQDYVFDSDNNCIRSNVVANDAGTSEGEDVTRSTIFANNVLVDKSVSAENLVQGQVATYTLELQNVGLVAQSITLSDTIPAGASYLAGTASHNGVLNNGSLVWQGLTLGVDETLTVTFQMRVDEDLVATAAIFFDNMESGGGNWVATHGDNVADQDWQLVNTTLGGVATTAWVATNISSRSDQYLTLASPITLPADARMSFSHAYATEAGFDGGVVEISTDGGSTWADLGDAMLVNGYNGSLPTLYGNPLGGREAFTGDSGGRVETIVDLANYGGQSVLIRFRMGTDESVAAQNWIVDDVSIGTISLVTNQAQATAGNRTYTSESVSSFIFEGVPLTVNVEGGGVVTSNPGAISCGLVCQEGYAPNTVVELTADGPFLGWGGACTGVTGNSCMVTMDEAQTVTATFEVTYPLTVGVTGNGTVTSDVGNISCGSVCQDAYVDGTVVVLTAVGDFLAWGGDCAGTVGNSCAVTMNQARAVTASFAEYETYLPLVMKN